MYFTRKVRKKIAVERILTIKSEVYLDVKRGRIYESNNFQLH